MDKNQAAENTSSNKANNGNSDQKTVDLNSKSDHENNKPDSTLAPKNNQNASSDNKPLNQNDLPLVVTPPQTATLGARVWIDTNGNKKLDNSELGKAAVLVKLYTPNGKFLGETTTDAQGYYKFNNLAPGEYKVEIQPPSGFQLGQGNHPRAYVLKAGDNTEADGGDLLAVIKTGNIKGHAYLDTNNNGLQDSNESSKAGIYVNLFNSKGYYVGMTYTDSLGNYQFNNLQPDNYKVSFYTPTGLALNKAGTDQLSSLIAVSSENTTKINDIGLIKEGIATGRVWIDSNRDGIQDSSEIGKQGVYVAAYNRAGNLLSATTTDKNGNYSLTRLPEGDFRVQVTPSQSHVFSKQDIGSNDKIDSDVDSRGSSSFMSIKSGETKSGFDAGIFHLGSITGKMWLDDNSNGIQDSNENAQTKMSIVKLYDINNKHISTAYTNSAGGYQFLNIEAGQYRVQFEPVKNYVFTQKDVGDDTKDSDVDSNGRAELLIIKDGQVTANINAGLIKKASISSRVWLDRDRDGDLDNNEYGKAGVTVKLTTPNGEVVASTVTDYNGNYTFDKLEAGAYKVSVEAPTGFALGKNVTPNAYAVKATENLIAKNIPLVIPTSNINSRVWIDADRDGVIDTDEQGKAGVTVKLTQANGQVVATTHTDTNGAYRFDGVDAGVYKLQVEAPKGLELGKSFAPHAFSIKAGETLTSKSTPLVTPASTISSRVWTDTDRDGEMDTGERGKAGVTVKLMQADGKTLATTVTDYNGNYRFNNLNPGTYKVLVESPKGLELGKGYTSAAYTINAGETVSSKATPLIAPESIISSRIWVDSDRDSIIDSNEQGKAGITVKLTQTNGQVVATTVTDVNGNYRFDNLNVGLYKLQIEPPKGLEIAKSFYPYTYVSKAGETINTKATPLVTPLPASISSRVWVDSDRDGIVDSGEKGKAGVTVNLAQPNGQIVASTVTDTNGYYRFDKLEAGAYKLLVETPKEFELGKDFTPNAYAIKAGETIYAKTTPLVTPLPAVKDLLANDNALDKLLGKVNPPANNNNAADIGNPHLTNGNNKLANLLDQHDIS